MLSKLSVCLSSLACSWLVWNMISHHLTPELVRFSNNAIMPVKWKNKIPLNALFTFCLHGRWMMATEQTIASCRTPPSSRTPAPAALLPKPPFGLKDANTGGGGLNPDLGLSLCCCLKLLWGTNVRLGLCVSVTPQKPWQSSRRTYKHTPAVLSYMPAPPLFADGLIGSCTWDGEMYLSELYMELQKCHKHPFNRWRMLGNVAAMYQAFYTLNKYSV